MEGTFEYKKFPGSLCRYVDRGDPGCQLGRRGHDPTIRPYPISMEAPRHTGEQAVPCGIRLEKPPKTHQGLPPGEKNYSFQVFSPYTVLLQGRAPGAEQHPCHPLHWVYSVCNIETCSKIYKV